MNIPFYLRFMTAEPLKDFSRLCVHTITTKGWELEEAVDRCGESALESPFGGNGSRDEPAEAGQRIRAGIGGGLLCRGGFIRVGGKIPGKSVEDNKRAIEDAAALGALLVVLVCGAVPGQSLVESRKQITDGIASTFLSRIPWGQAGHRASSSDVRR